ncbi:porin [Rhodobacter capsulatus]|uniref:porin n=1 Tax=Rhodobacter capsulatus TaxID=1061 RepID=UPI004027DD7D
MKKLLIASTALVMVAGAAAAEVKLSGNARMGVVYNGDDAYFSSRARVVFTLSGTTDSGLEFGATFRADEAGDTAANNGAAFGNEGTVFISGAFGKIEMGDTVSAPEALFGDLYEVGYTDLAMGGLSNDIPYLTGDGNGAGGTSAGNPSVLYTYSAGAFSVAASMTDGVNATPAGDPSNAVTADDATQYAVAGAYTFGNYTVGLGYEVIDPVVGADVDQVELAGTAKFGATNVKAYYASISALVDAKAYGVSVDTTFGATTVGGYVQTIDSDFNPADVTWYGLGASYDLGGGASIVGGIADNDLPNSDMVADFGVKFKF